jgi:hypothetical protein
MVALGRALKPLESEMRTILLTVALIAFAAPSHAAQKTSKEKECREMVGKEQREGEGGNSHVGQLQVQRFSDCMMGTPQ